MTGFITPYSRSNSSLTPLAHATITMASRWRRALYWALIALVCLACSFAQAQQSVVLRQAVIDVQDEAVYLNAAVAFELSPAIEDALLKGAPLFFEATASITRDRWYWWDARLAEVSRSVRISYEPLLRRYRVSTGGFNQTVDTLVEALTLAQRGIRLRLSDRAAFRADRSYAVEFNYRLDTTRLPRLFQIGGVAQRDFALTLESKRIEFRVPDPRSETKAEAK
jgi:hypothetical protein